MMAETSVDVLPDIDTTPKRRRSKYDSTKQIGLPTRCVRVATGIHFAVGLLIVYLTPMIMIGIDSSAAFIQNHHFTIVPVFGLAMMLYSACLPAKNSLVVVAGLIPQTLVLVLSVFCLIMCGFIFAALKPWRPVPPGMDDEELLAAALAQSFATVFLVLSTVAIIITTPMLVSLWMVRKHASLSRRTWISRSTVWISGISVFLFVISLVLEKVVAMVRMT